MFPIDPTIGHPQGAFEVASVEISTEELNALVSQYQHLCNVTHKIANTPDSNVPHLTPSWESPTGKQDSKREHNSSKSKRH